MLATVLRASHVLTHFILTRVPDYRWKLRAGVLSILRSHSWYKATMEFEPWETNMC